MLATSILSFTHQTESTQWFEGVSFTLNYFVAQNEICGNMKASTNILCPVIAPLKRGTEIIKKLILRLQSNKYSDLWCSLQHLLCKTHLPRHQVNDCQQVTPFLNKTIGTPATYMWTLSWYYFNNAAVFTMAPHPTRSDFPGYSWNNEGCRFTET